MDLVDVALLPPAAAPPPLPLVVAALLLCSGLALFRNGKWFERRECL